MPSSFASPPAATECREAVWSQGGACKTCIRTDCYRVGWTAERASKDNLRRVVEKLRERGMNA